MFAFFSAFDAAVHSLCFYSQFHSLVLTFKSPQTYIFKYGSDEREKKTGNFPFLSFTALCISGSFSACTALALLYPIYDVGYINHTQCVRMRSSRTETDLKCDCWSTVPCCASGRIGWMDGPGSFLRSLLRSLLHPREREEEGKKEKRSFSAIPSNGGIQWTPPPPPPHSTTTVYSVDTYRVRLLLRERMNSI